MYTIARGLSLKDRDIRNLISTYSIMNPYDILGVSHVATLKEIKQAYKKLAIANHPDKLQHIPASERAVREEYFKKVTVAYNILLDESRKQKNDKYTAREHGTEYWKDMWTKMESFMSQKNMWEKVFDVATKCASAKVHTAKLPVSLEEIYTKKQKKVELILKGIATPVLTTVGCEAYPFTTVYHEDVATGRYHTINLQLKVKDHDVYELVDDGTLVTNVEIDFFRYITGCQVHIPFLDESDVCIEVSPFTQVDTPIILPGKGLDARYDMHVYVHIGSITSDAWNRLSEEEQQILMTILRKILGYVAT
jgi:DnaJ-class molecular chaperone